MVLSFSCDGVPFKSREKQFINTDYLSCVLTPLIIRWKISSIYINIFYISIIQHWAVSKLIFYMLGRIQRWVFFTLSPAMFTTTTFSPSMFSPWRSFRRHSICRCSWMNHIFSLDRKISKASASHRHKCSPHSIKVWMSVHTINSKPISPISFWEHMYSAYLLHCSTLPAEDFYF
jgi:hypothetical protein